MLPRNVYEHIKYGNGAKPGASLKLANGTSYTVSKVDRRIVATFYPADFLTNRQTKSKNVRLSDIPDRPESEWNIYWTHEC